MDGIPPLAWAEGNAEILRLWFADLTLRLSGADAAPLKINRQIEVIEARMERPSGVTWVMSRFDLHPIEVATLLLAAMADEMPELAAPLQEHRFSVDGRATPALVQGVLGQSDHLSSVGALRRFRLIVMGAEGRTYERPFCVAAPVLDALQGRVAFDEDYIALLQPAPRAIGQAGEHNVAFGRVWMQSVEANSSHVFWTDAQDTEAQTEQVAQVCAALNHPLVRLHATNLPQDGLERAELALKLRRDLRLSGQYLLLMAQGAEPAAWELAERVAMPVIVIGSPPPVGFHGVGLRLPRVDAPCPWEAVLGPTLAARPDVKSVARSYRLTSPQARRAAHAMAAGLAPDLWSAAQAEIGDQLGPLARRVTGPAHWDDLVLPAAQSASLGQMAAFLRNRDRVNDTWGFGDKSSRGLGMAAVFYGPSGTGKTTAAEALVSQMRPSGSGTVPLYRVNVAALVSKYIGETAKNFETVFRAGEAMGAALIFDEAEGLFARRTGNVKDSNDKHSNAELGFLLQCLEVYSGIAILTTNMRSAIDDAFFRRFRFAIEFPFPDRVQRLAIWHRVLPDALPRAALDFDALARVSLAGGNIRSVAINAAYLAASEDSVLSMGHLAQSVRLEFSKLEKTPPDRELKGWVT